MNSAHSSMEITLGTVTGDERLITQVYFDSRGHVNKRESEYSQVELIGGEQEEEGQRARNGKIVQHARTMP